MNLVALVDAGMIVPILGLAGVSLSIIASTSPDLFLQQLTFFIVGLLLYIIFASIDYRVWSKFSWFFYISSLIFLTLSFFGSEIRGSTRWIDIGWLHLQPSELIKPFITLVIVTLLLQNKKANIYSRLKLFMVAISVVFLIFKQPDLGNALVYLFTFISLEIINGIPFVYLIGISFSLGILMPGIWLFLKQYQKVRLLSFINPYADPIGAGYNAIQAIIAIGSGQLTGLGLGRGTQSHLLFLPEYHTDFVFASLGEEFGFLGALFVIFFYLILFVRILKISNSCEDSFGKVLSIGIFTQLFIQVFINIGMNIGLLPITGITLPLLSYGGSSIVSTFVGLGLVASVSYINKKRNTIVIR